MTCEFNAQVVSESIATLRKTVANIMRCLTGLAVNTHQHKPPLTMLMSSEF